MTIRKRVVQLFRGRRSSFIYMSVIASLVRVNEEEHITLKFVSQFLRLFTGSFKFASRGPCANIPGILWPYFGRRACLIKRGWECKAITVLIEKSPLVWVPVQCNAFYRSIISSIFQKQQPEEEYLLCSISGCSSFRRIQESTEFYGHTYRWTSACLV